MSTPTVSNQPPANDAIADAIDTLRGAEAAKRVAGDPAGANEFATIANELESGVPPTMVVAYSQAMALAKRLTEDDWGCRCATVAMPPCSWCTDPTRTEDDIRDASDLERDVVARRRAIRRQSCHIGRAFTGHAIEDECPCTQASCGLVDTSGINEECPQHSFEARKTIRQGHVEADCPGSDLSSLPDLREGDQVAVTIRGRVTEVRGAGFSVVYKTGFADRVVSFRIGGTHIDVARRLPDNWPPRAGDVWSGGNESVWFVTDDPYRPGQTMRSACGRYIDSVPDAWLRALDGMPTLLFRVPGAAGLAQTVAEGEVR